MYDIYVYVTFFSLTPSFFSMANRMYFLRSFKKKSNKKIAIAIYRIILKQNGYHIKLSISLTVTSGHNIIISSRF